TATKDEILKFLEGKLVKWGMPDDVLFVDEIPHTATGKIQKTVLRERYGKHRRRQAAEGRGGRDAVLGRRGAPGLRGVRRVAPDRPHRLVRHTARFLDLALRALHPVP